MVQANNQVANSGKENDEPNFTSLNFNFYIWMKPAIIWSQNRHILFVYIPQMKKKASGSSVFVLFCKFLSVA